MNGNWTKKEKTVARKIFNNAYEKEAERIKNQIEEMLKEIKEAGDIWKIQEFLDEKRKEINEKYDYRYSQLIFVFARLMAENLVNEEDLDGLSEEKKNKIIYICKHTRS